jgi:hypothetical protein
MMVSIYAEPINLEQNCLTCHQSNQIPDRLIYKRYLMKYSTSNRIEEAMLQYLKNPNQHSSIMPPQFFLKFPMKKVLNRQNKDLVQYIRAYIQKYDIKKNMILERSSQ